MFILFYDMVSEINSCALVIVIVFVYVLRRVVKHSLILTELNMSRPKFESLTLPLHHVTPRSV